MEVQGDGGGCTRQGAASARRSAHGCSRVLVVAHGTHQQVPHFIMFLMCAGGCTLHPPASSTLHCVSHMKSSLFRPSHALGQAAPSHRHPWVWPSCAHGFPPPSRPSEQPLVAQEGKSGLGARSEPLEIINHGPDATDIDRATFAILIIVIVIVICPTIYKPRTPDARAP